MNITGLTIGLTAFLLIVLYVNDELSYDTFHKDKDRIYRGMFERKDWGIRPMLASDYLEIVGEDIPEIESFVRLSRAARETMVATNLKALNIEQVYHTDTNFFQFFDFELIDGKSSSAFADSRTAVITKSVAEQLFGDANPVGEYLIIEKGERYLVTAVAADVPQNSTIQYEVLLHKPGQFKNRFEETYGIKSVITYIKLVAGAAPELVAEKLTGLREKPIYQQFTKDNAYALLALTDQRLRGPYQQDIFEKNDIRYVRLFSGIGVVVLLLALINYVNLVTAQAVRRRKEVGLRKVIGASRRQLIFYQLTESSVITMIAFLFAFAIAERLMPIFNEVLDKQIVIQYFSIEFFTWVVLFGIILGLLSGLYPAFIISASRPLTLLKKSGDKKGSGVLRRVLVLIQFVSTAVLILVLSIMNKQMNFLKEKDLGYNPEFVVSVPLDADSTHLYNKLKNSFESISGVKTTSLNGFTPGGGSITTVMDGPNKSGEGAESVAESTVFADGDFFETMNMELLWTAPEFSLDNFSEGQMIISKSLAEKMGWLDQPEGKRLYSWSDNVGRAVVAIVSDFNLKSLKEPVEPMVILPLSDWGTRNVFIKLETEEVSASIDRLRDTYEGMFDRPFVFRFLDDEIAAFYKKEQGQFLLFQVFSGLALSVSLLGLFALTLYAIEQRRKEVSVRKVLGASVQRLILMLNREYSILVLVAFIVASPIAYYAMQGWLEEFEYRVTLSPLVFIVAFLAFLVLCWLVTIARSLKVSQENPADVLREE